MKNIKLELTIEELTLLTGLASDQLFRREFIDPKMPGYKADPEDVPRGKALVGRLRLMIVEAGRGSSAAQANLGGRDPGGQARRTNGTPDAL